MLNRCSGLIIAATVAVVGLLPSMGAAQAAAAAANAAIPLTRIDPAITPIALDGHLNEQIWRTAAAIDNFRVLEPDTLEPGEFPSRYGRRRGTR